MVLAAWYLCFPQDLHFYQAVQTILKRVVFYITKVPGSHYNQS